MRHATYFFWAALAWLRGLAYHWPRGPTTPAGYSGAHCGLPRSRDAREMFVRHNWKPYCFQYTPYGVARHFIIPDEDP